MSTHLPIATSIDRQPPGMLGLLSNLANRHGCISGATGTGKTVTLQVIAQALSNIISARVTAAARPADPAPAPAGKQAQAAPSSAACWDRSSRSS